MSTKHTRGPWKCDKDPVFGSWFVRQDPKDWNGMGYQLICDCPAERKGTHYGDMFKANAALIAAAPDLLDGCNALLGLIQLITGRDDLPPAIREALETSHRVDEAKAAIAKALPPALAPVELHSNEAVA
jgi:hypothetical protein